MTNASSSRLPICGTMARGLATPMGPVTTTPPHNISGSSAETSVKLMFTPVAKFSASASRRNPVADQASQTLPAAKWKRTNQTMDSTNIASGTWAQRSVAA